jgi:hypothetical protein
VTRRAALAAVFAVSCVATLALCAPAVPAGAQVPVPPVPPLPPQATTVLEYVAPVASPACGTVGFAALIVQGAAVLPIPLPIAVPTVFGPLFVVCGAVPSPNNRLRCSPDDTVQGVLDQVFLAALGSQSLVSGRVTGPVVEEVVVVQNALPPPLNTAGLGSLAVATLTCRPEDTAAAPAPGAGAPADVTAPVVVDDTPDLSGAGDALGGDQSLAIAPVDEGVTDLAAGPAVTGASTARPASAIGSLIGGRPVNALFFVLPLLAIALCAVLARGLLAEPDAD